MWNWWKGFIAPWLWLIFNIGGAHGAYELSCMCLLCSFCPYCLSVCSLLTYAATEFVKNILIIYVVRIIGRLCRVHGCYCVITNSWRTLCYLLTNNYGKTNGDTRSDQIANLCLDLWLCTKSRWKSISTYPSPIWPLFIIIWFIYLFISFMIHNSIYDFDLFVYHNVKWMTKCDCMVQIHYYKANI